MGYQSRSNGFAKSQKQDVRLEANENAKLSVRPVNPGGSSGLVFSAKDLSLSPTFRTGNRIITADDLSDKQFVADSMSLCL
jgi:hypothetical protein